MNHPSFHHLDHRPWPAPRRKWTLRQTWCDLLFAHWPIASERLRPLIPEALAIDEFDGTAWIGVIPFRMEGVTGRGLPSVPGLSAFPELNVRTYVVLDGRPGVWFFSLDAGNTVAVWVARRFFHLPYFHAQMSTQATSQGISYQSRRLSSNGTPVLFLGSYRPISAAAASQPGSLPHWLTERYCLYAQGRKGGIYRADVHHAPWPLQQAEADLSVNSMFDPLGLSLPTERPVLHFARKLDVVIWAPQRLAGVQQGILA